MNRGACEFLVLSVRPKFAEAIVDGRKTIEVRRQRPSVHPGTLGFVYSSSPIQAVVGSFRVDGICSGTPEELWTLAQSGAHISRQDFDSYFAGADFGHAIVVSCGQRLPNPIKLSHLRVVWPGCKPPRSFGYLVAADVYSQRIMSAFRDRSFKGKTPLKELGKDHDERNGVQDRRGSFLLKSDKVRVLASLLGVEGR